MIHDKDIGIVEKEYFVLTKYERKDPHLPPKFDEEIFDGIINPLHHKNLLHLEDGNYVSNFGDFKDVKK